ncbi:MAG: PAS domain-containing protein, partial [Acidimicrobiia bacterium]
MPAPAIEMVLLKQVASYLAMPIFVVDAEGALVYYNEPAEELLGYRYEETGQLPLESWGQMWTPTDAQGDPLAPERLPVAIAAREHRPALD